jgi:hypothetical protein
MIFPLNKASLWQSAPYTFLWALMLGACVFFGHISASIAGAVNATVSVTITASEGSVGEEPTPEPTPTPTPTPTPSVSLVNGGGATSPAAAVQQLGVTTFRPLSAAIAAPAETSFSPTSETNEPAASGGGGESGSGTSTAATGSRLPQGAQPVGNLLGGMSAVAVSGSPNQHYGISLPGSTVFTQGNKTTVIEGFVHNAGATPAMSPFGKASFNVGAKITPEAQGDSATPSAPTAGAAEPNYQGPIITSDPFMDVIISYN